jgi:Raf kinase inhibitor-like YbhB/YbcL family protein
LRSLKRTRDIKNSMKLAGPELEKGEMPEKSGYIGENVNPELEIINVPDEAETLALLLEDPDAVEAAGKIWLHWLTWNIPADTEKISEGESPGPEGETDFPEPGYNGPNPPDGEHTLVFKIYALETELDLEEGAGREKFEDAIQGHVVEDAELEAHWPHEHQTKDE